MAKERPFDLQAALQRCNDEPILSPGVIQSCGALLALHNEDFTIRYASENAGDMFGCPTSDLFGIRLGELCGSKFVHDLRNCVSRFRAKRSRQFVSLRNLRDVEYFVSVSPSDDLWILEFEPADQRVGIGENLFQDLAFLSDQLHAAIGVQQLADRLVQVLSVLSEYDRVMVYRFDAEWNGEVIAERISANLEPYLGLRFPHWDIPPRARAAMLQFPLRFIHDVESPPLNILSAAPDDPPLDITYAQLRGTASVHLQYLRNMGVAGTMTLSLVVEGTLWGLISFHHKTAKLPSLELRQLCSFLAPIINTKLDSLQRAQSLEMLEKMSRLRYELEEQASGGACPRDAQIAVDAALQSFPVDGVALGLGDDFVLSGTTPPAHILRAIRNRTQQQDAGIWHTQCLSDDLPDHAAHLGDVCGALCLVRKDGRWICLLRKSRAGALAWAGAPEKDIDLSDGLARLHPRGSFSLYRQAVQNTSEPWFEQDKILLKGMALGLTATVKAG